VTVHIGAAPGDIAEIVLMPGDPMRAQWAARRFLDGAECINRTRGMLGFTGFYRGTRVTIQGSGMGMPSLSIYANELIRDYGAKTLIRIGSAGAMQEWIRLHDLVLAQTASSLSTPSSAVFRELNFAPCANFRLLEHADDVCRRTGRTAHVGGIYSSDTFYDERPDLNDQMTRHGVLAVEMETAELYILAARHGCRALSILTISDHLLTGEVLSPEERETGFSAMVEIALETATAAAAP
jgi:purine-nucleoside phosphorylase